jgi:rRNA maturation endonuclease Nob1
VLGSPDALPFTSELDLVCVVDTSVLIKLKRLVRIDDQWDMLSRMSELVRSGQLAFPRQVAAELAYGQYPDAPGAWIGSAKRHVCYSPPSEDTLRRILEVAEQLVDAEANSDHDVADPYVVAMAYEITSQHPGCRVTVATDDYVDRLPMKLSLTTACQRFNIERWTPEQFIAWVGGNTDSDDWPGGSPAPPASSR